MNRVLITWGVMFLLTTILVGNPTEFRWAYWIYGLIWGGATSLLHIVFRGFFEEEIDN
ncbi:MAG: hypothetical protein AAGU11_05845 [Syntrophobacteraceae bacterium]